MLGGGPPTVQPRQKLEQPFGQPKRPPNGLSETLAAQQITVTNANNECTGRVCQRNAETRVRSVTATFPICACHPLPTSSNAKNAENSLGLMSLDNLGSNGYRRKQVCNCRS